MWLMVTVLDWPTGIAYALQAVVSIVTKFCLNWRLVWRDREVKFVTAFGRFLGSRVFTVLFNQGLFNTLAWAARLLPPWQYWYLVAQVTCVVVVALVDFKVMDAYVFRVANRHRRPHGADTERNRGGDQ
jgi:putative flippase GtrA